jgi:hypothetical protein
VEKISSNLKKQFIITQKQLDLVYTRKQLGITLAVFFYRSLAIFCPGVGADCVVFVAGCAFAGGGVVDFFVSNISVR